ncbi:MAG: hypothetical protein ACJ71D_03545 [Nitrososphaera sp.]
MLIDGHIMALKILPQTNATSSVAMTSEATESNSISTTSRADG